MTPYQTETEERYEYWNGLIVHEPASSEHECIISNLTLAILSFIKKEKKGKVFGSNAAIYLHGDVTRKDFRLADLSYVAADRLDMVQSKGIYGAPDLLVEILSPGKRSTNRDRVEKRQLYEQFGVQEYWIVHPYEEEIAIYGLQEGKYERLEQSRLLEGVDLNREDIFE